ncbi:ester cyclase [Frankia sp. QA3]|uniref:ester cyclase n=1 Tax=Frankia sp. QA3 TaxID=710111 RepID=UPI000269C8C4|nr:ester cyclase [Frankia sp. QA3]EIV94861.1 putative ester cyclase [Frankia sp. QA3]
MSVQTLIESPTEGVAGRSVEERNKNIVRRVFDEFVNRGDFTVVDEIYRPDMVDHQPLPGAPEGLDGVRYTIAGLREGFPDLHVTIEDMSANADHVVIHNTWRGTHHGDFLGLAPTGRVIEFRGVVVWRLQDGRIAERWGIGVESNMLAELGLRRLAPGARGAARPRAGGSARPVTNLLPVLPGRAEQWRALQAQLAGPRLRDYEASRRRVGIVRESFWKQEAGDVEMVVHTLEARDPRLAGRRLRDSDHPFDGWLREAARAVYGADPWAELAAGRTAERGHGWASVGGELTSVVSA